MIGYFKTLHIRNTHGGLIWQVYHVKNISEAAQLTKNAMCNGFYSASLVDYTGEEETWPDWRETEGGKKIIEEDYE
jgi:hypothetical protein